MHECFFLAKVTPCETGAKATQCCPRARMLRVIHLLPRQNCARIQRQVRISFQRTSNSETSVERRWIDRTSGTEIYRDVQRCTLVRRPCERFRLMAGAFHVRELVQRSHQRGPDTAGRPMALVLGVWLQPVVMCLLCPRRPERAYAMRPDTQLPLAFLLCMA